MSESRTLHALLYRIEVLEAQHCHLQNVNALLADAAHLSPAERDTLDQLLRMIDGISR